MSASASSRDSAFAVRRTFTSAPPARYATVGFVEPWNRSSSSSAIFDSAIPTHRSVREISAEGPARADSSGRTVPSIISRISAGTPGST